MTGRPIRSRRDPSSVALRRRFLVLLVVAVVGLGLAIMHASSTAWWWQSVSALGIDPGADAWFNAAMVVLGVVFLWTSVPLRVLVRRAVRAGVLRPGWGRAYGAGLALIGPALMLVGVFEISSPGKSLIHDLAGFFVPLAVMGMMLTFRLAAPVAGRGLAGAAFLLLAAIVGLFLLAVSETISYALMEILAFLICGGWLYRVALRLEGTLDQPPTSPGTVLASA